MRSLGARWVRAASSGHFFTRWSWLLTLPLAVTVLGGYDQAVDAGGRFTGLAIALGVHVTLGAFGLLAAAAERASARRGLRVAIVLTALALIAIGRPVLMAGTADAWGVSLYSGPLAGRVATNAVVVTAVLSIVAMLTTAALGHREVANRLRGVLAALDEQRSNDLADVDELSAQLLDTARDSILESFPPAALRPFDAHRAGLLLQRFADDVVRPASHRLFDQACATGVPAGPGILPGPGIVADPSSDGSGHHGGRRSIVSDVSAAPVWLTAIGYVLLWGPHFLAATQPADALAGLPALVAAVLVGAGGNRLVRTASTRISAIHRVAVLAGAYAVVGAAIGTAGAVVPALFGGGGPASGTSTAILLSTVLYPFFAILAAIVDAWFERLSTVESSLAEAIDHSAALTAAAHNRLAVARRRVAHLLHGQVQAECAAAVRSLQTSSLSEADWAGLLKGIELRLEYPHSPSRSTAGDSEAEFEAEAEADVDAEATIDDLVSAWRFGLEIEVVADGAVWERLDTDPARLELAVDVLAEGLTNAIRHGAGRRARVGIQPSTTSAGVVVEIVSPGRLAMPPAGDGYGIAQLAHRAHRVSLTQDGTDVLLRVETA